MLAAGRRAHRENRAVLADVRLVGWKHVLDDEYQWLEEKRGQSWWRTWTSSSTRSGEFILQGLSGEPGRFAGDVLPTMKGRMKLTDRTIEAGMARSIITLGLRSADS